MEMKRQLGLVAVLALFLVSCGKERSSAFLVSDDGIVLDANVPGTAVFLEGTKLGTVPVSLNAASLAKLGIPNPQRDTNIIFNSDAFGEAVYIIQQGTPQVNFTFAVPDERRKEFVDVETPWGNRTRHAGGSFSPQKSFRVNFMPRVRSDGLSLSIQWVQTNSTPWTLRATLENHGTKGVEGVAPKLQIARSAFSDRWQNDQPSQIQLPPSWCRVSPNSSMSTDVSVTPPVANGNYAVYAIFSLLKDGSTNLLAGDGWCYSNTKLLATAH